MVTPRQNDTRKPYKGVYLSRGGGLWGDPTLDGAWRACYREGALTRRRRSGMKERRGEKWRHRAEKQGGKRRVMRQR